MDTLMSKLSLITILVLTNLIICLVVNLVAIVQAFRKHEIKNMALQTPQDSNNEPKHADSNILNAEANQRFLRQAIKRLFIDVEVLRKDSEARKKEYQLQIRQLHQEHEAAVHNWAREKERLVRAVDKVRRDKELCQMQWADDTQAHQAELKSAAEMMETAEDIVELLEEQLADERRNGLLESEATPTDAIIDHFNWFAIAIEELTKSCFAIDDPSAPIKSIMNPVEFPSQESFFAYWDSQKGLNKREMQNRIRSEIFVCLQNHIFRQAWFGVPQSIEKDNEDVENHCVAESYQHIEGYLGVLENRFQHVADMTSGYEQEFRDWRLRTMKCISYISKPQSPHGILEIAGRIADFFSPIPSTLPAATVRETFNQLAISAYEFVLLVRAQKGGDYGLLFVDEGVKFDDEWMEIVDFEHLSGNADLERAKGEMTAANEQGWKVAFARAPAFYHQLPGEQMVVVVKAQVVVFGNPKSGSPSTPTLSLSSQSPIYSTLSSPLLFSSETAAENDEKDLECSSPASSSSLETASPLLSIPDSPLSHSEERNSEEEQSSEKGVHVHTPSTKTAELRKFVEEMQRDQIEIQAAGSLSAWVSMKSTVNQREACSRT